MKRNNIFWLTLFIITFVFNISHAANLLTNPGFEDGDLWPSDGWSYDVVDINTDYNHTSGGHYSLKILYPGAEVGQHFLATPGYIYDLSGWIMSPSTNPIKGTGVGAFIKLIWKNASGTQIGTAIESATKVTGSSSWKNIVIEDAVAPADAMYGKYLFVLKSATSGAAYYDDSFCEGVAPPPPPVPEPATLLLLGTGLTGLLAFSRRKK